MRIIKELDLPSDFIFQDIKETPITVAQLDAMQSLSGNYESLFSKRAKLYKEMGLKNQPLEERDYKHYILHHYTFLKRPVLIIDDKIFIGNSAKTVAATKTYLESINL